MKAVSRSGREGRGDPLRWLVLLTVCSLVFVVYMMQYQVSALSYVLIPSFDLDPLEFSNLMFAPMLLAAIAGIPLGALADRYGVRRVVGACLVVTFAAAAARIFARDYEALIVTTTLLGMAPAALNATVIRLLGNWFGDSTSFAIGVYYASSGLGASAAMLTSTAIGGHARAFFLIAAAFLVVMVLWWAAVRNAPRSQYGSADGKRSASFERAETVAKGIASASLNRYVWIIALITGFGLAAKSAYLGFLPQALGTQISVSEANALASLVAYGGVLGCVFGPALCMRQKHPRAFVIGCALLAACLMGVTSATLNSPMALVLLLTGLSTSVTAPIVESIPCALPSLKDCVGSAGGIIGSVSLAVSYAAPMVITAISGGSPSVMIALTAVCFLLTVPLLMALPGFTPDDVRGEIRAAD